MATARGLRMSRLPDRGSDTEGSVPDEGPPAQQAHPAVPRVTTRRLSRASVDSVQSDTNLLASLAWDFLQYTHADDRDLQQRRAPHSADRLRINQVRKVLTAFFPALSCKEVQWVLDLKDGQTDITFQEFAKKLSSLQEKSKGDDWDPVAAFTALSGSSGSTPDAPTLDFERFRDVWAQLGVNCVDEEVARQLIGRVLRRDLSSGPVTLDDFSRLCRLAMPMDATGRMEDLERRASWNSYAMPLPEDDGGGVGNFDQ